MIRCVDSCAMALQAHAADPHAVGLLDRVQRPVHAQLRLPVLPGMGSMGGIRSPASFFLFYIPDAICFHHIFVSATYCFYT